MTTLEILVVNSPTIQVTLPATMSVNITKPVPPDFLELLAVYSRMQQTGSLSDAEGCGVIYG